MKQFKVGDRVRVLDTYNVRNRWSGPKIIGHEFVIRSSYSAEELNKGHQNCADGNNTFGINYEASDLEIVREPFYFIEGECIAFKNYGVVTAEDWFKDIIHLIPEAKLVKYITPQITDEDLKILTKENEQNNGF